MDSLDEQIFDLNHIRILILKGVRFTSYLFIKSFRLKRKLALNIKKIIRLSGKKSTLEEILKYLSNV